MEEQTFDEYLAWKQTKYVQPSADVFVPQQPAPDDVVVNVELQSHNNNSELHATISHMEDNERKNDGLARDDVFLSLASERVQTTFAWRDILFSVPVKRSYFFNLIERKTGKTKDILSGVSGYCRPGEILFVMGPSGAGKSTMLDALADRIQLPVEGVQWLDGKRKTETNLRMISKYVQQDDCIMGALTVQEVMNTAAALYVKEPAKRQPLIAATLKMVGLMDQQHTKVGDVFFRGLSGGQKRRLSIAIELLALPSILFLDEPTSGLDSAAAFSIMASLRRVAKATNTNLIVTIHQPSQLLFELGDNLLLLSGGKQVYFGPIAVVESHFNMLGFDCPKRTSIAEWLLNLVNQDFGSIGVVERCIFGWKGSMAEQALTKILEDMQVPKAVEDAGKLQRAPFIQHYAVGQLTQVMALLKRGTINSVRAPAVIWLRFAMYFFLAILIGTVWLLLGYSAKVINDINGMLFYCVAFMIFMSISVLPAYLDERSQFVRERANGSYSVFAYLFSHFLFELPFIFLISLVCSSTVYWLVGLYPDPTRFFVFLANLYLSLLVAESYMVLISAIIPYFIVGIAVGAFLFGAYMCVMGFFIAFSQIGWWWRWMRYIAVHFYSFSTFMTNQHTNSTYTAYCPNPLQYPCYPNDVAGETLIVYYDLEGRIWVNFVVMIAMIIILRVLAGVYLHFRVKGKK